MLLVVTRTLTVNVKIMTLYALFTMLFIIFFASNAKYKTKVANTENSKKISTN